jgi:hypothetical protein
MPLFDNGSQDAQFKEMDPLLGIGSRWADVSIGSADKVATSQRRTRRELQSQRYPMQPHTMVN